MLIDSDVFREITDREHAKRVFVNNVERIEMETHSYCNRRCSYCPNVVGDRLTNLPMPADIWEMVVSGLEEIDYRKYLILNYYNEPLADRSILERIREARARVPKCRIMIYTNGDYLEPGLVEELAEAGLDYMHVSIHLKRGDEYSDLYVINRINEVSVRMGIPTRLTTIRSREFAFGVAPHPKLEIEVRGINFHKHGTDRGGLIGDIATAQKRARPCFFPFAHFVLAYNGLLAPCCHIRSDRPEHVDFIYGNLRDYGSIFQAFTSASAAAWRREVGSDQVKRSPCDTCAAGVLNEPGVEQGFLAAYQRHSGVATPAPTEG